MKKLLESKAREIIILFVIIVTFFLLIACDKSDAKENLEIAENDESMQISEDFNLEETEKKEEEESDFFNDERVIDKNGKMVALTFDDGPSVKYTPSILGKLKDHNALATFFELGSLAEKNSEIILSEYEAGHEIGNHSFSHVDLSTSSYEEVINEITKTNDILEDITGKKPIYIRPPYGNLNKEAINNTGMSVILWSVDVRDWQSKDEEKIMNVIKEYEDLDGHVILMHSTQEATANVLDELLTYLEENEYQCVTISELFEYKYNLEPQKGGTYGYTFFSSAKAGK